MLAQAAESSLSRRAGTDCPLMCRRGKTCARRAYCSPTLGGAVVSYSGAEERTRQGWIDEPGGDCQSLEQIGIYESR